MLKANRVRTLGRALLVLATAWGSPLTAQAIAAQPKPDPRDAWQRVADIFKALGAISGSRIADVGAGDGWLTIRLSRQVGPTGSVIASDIAEYALKGLAKSIADHGLTNVTVVQPTENDTKLPLSSLDGVVMVNAYHEMNQPVAVLQGIRRSLKPGGIVVIVDNVSSGPSRPRAEQLERHELAIDLARDDLKAQGFEVLSSDPRFVVRDPMQGPDQWMLVARRP